MTTEQTGQLVEQLAKRFSDVLSTALQEAIAGAVEKVKEEFEETRRCEFEKLFDTQLETLKGRGVPQMIIDGFWKQKSEVVKKAMEMTIEDGNVPFVPIIPLPSWGICYLMKMVGGCTKLTLSLISDVVKTPKNPYYIYNVDDGSNRKSDESLEEVKQEIREQNHSPLTLAESIALKLHNEELPNLDMVALGSRYEKKQIPIILFKSWIGGDRPTLMAMGVSIGGYKLAIPSCSSRG